jgi:hypothetical protein
MLGLLPLSSSQVETHCQSSQHNGTAHKRVIERERACNAIINSSLCESVRHKRIKWLHRIIIFTPSALRTNNGINATAANGTEIIHPVCMQLVYTHFWLSMHAAAAECDVSSARVTCATYCIVHLQCEGIYYYPS